jgi:hypothetical protein
MGHVQPPHTEPPDGAGNPNGGALSALTALPSPSLPPSRPAGQETDAMTRTANAFRALLARLLPRTPTPPRQSDIERALLRALGGL